jgi:hypothetical protein
MGVPGWLAVTQWIWGCSRRSSGTASISLLALALALPDLDYFIRPGVLFHPASPLTLLLFSSCIPLFSFICHCHHCSMIPSYPTILTLFGESRRLGTRGVFVPSIYSRLRWYCHYHRFFLVDGSLTTSDGQFYLLEPFLYISVCGRHWVAHIGPSATGGVRAFNHISRRQ